MGRMTLVLWDIDLTLVDYSGLGRRFYTEALTNVLGITLGHLPEFSGRTERSLIKELLTRHGIDDHEDNVQLMFAELIRLTAEVEPDLGTLGRALPGAAEVLASVRRREGVVQSLVTGNLPELAGYKLAPFGLDQHLDLDIGGYGSISVDRHDLVRSAITQAGAKYGRAFDPVVVIGDSPLDMRAARHHDATAVGVTTGRHTEEVLREAGAHAVLPGLADTETVLSVLLG
jgi:phosphoglycolate phosphatase